MSKLYNNLAWNTIIWAKVRKRVSRMQHRIFKAKRKGLAKTVIGLQIKLVKSLDARLLSVLQVTTYNKGRKTAGVDKQIVTNLIRENQIIQLILVTFQCLLCSFLICNCKNIIMSKVILQKIQAVEK